MIQEFTAESAFDADPVPMWIVKGSWFGVPIHHFRDIQSVAEQISDLRIVTKSIDIGFKTELFEEQQEVIDNFEKKYLKGGTGFILEAPPSFGKTVTVLKMISIINMRALVVVPRSNLVKQWVDRIKEHTSLHSRDIGFIDDGGKGVWRDKKIVVGLVHSLALSKQGDEFRKYFGCTVFDEVDRSVPPATFAPVVGMFPSKYRIGCTATLKRRDGMSVIFEKHIGEFFIKGKPTNRMKPKVIRVNFPMSSGYIPKTSQKLNRRGMLISKLAKNPIRNSVILDYVRLIVNSGRRCLVLSDRIEQLVVLRNATIKQFQSKISSREIGLYVRALPAVRRNGRMMGSTLKKEERERIEKEGKIIFATYGMFALGTDIKELAGLIYATPQSETEQSRGRIERFLEGKKTPILVDIVDTAHDDAMRWASHRMMEYRNKGLEIIVRRGKE